MTENTYTIDTEELYSSSYSQAPKDKLTSLRIPEALYSVLEGLTEAMKSNSVSETIRKILFMYVSPLVYSVEWRDKKPEAIPGNAEAMKLNRFLIELSEALEFLREAEEKGKKSLNFIQEKRRQTEIMILDLSRKMK